MTDVPQVTGLRTRLGLLAAKWGRALVRWTLPVALILAAGLAVLPASAAQINRQVLALFDGREETDAAYTRIHNRLEMPLNYLGFDVKYWDVNEGLPPLADARKYRAIITWFSSPVPEDDKYAAWVSRLAISSQRFIIFEVPGINSEEGVRGPLDNWLALLGLRRADKLETYTYQSRVILSDPAIMDFERPISEVLPAFEMMTAIGSAVEPHLTVSVPGSKNDTVLVSTGPRGGYVAKNYAVYTEPITGRTRWLLNPFAFLSEALGNTKWPVPDVTTLSGRRIFFNQIEGDGWNTPSNVERYLRLNMTASEVVLREIVSRFTDVPMSVGLIGSNVNAEVGGYPQNAKTARTLFALPNVEVASNTNTYPHKWDYFEDYSREDELTLISQRPSGLGSPADWFQETLRRAAGREEPHITFRSYISESGDLPRTYAAQPFSLESEVEGGIAAADALAPVGKPAALYLWSGDKHPFEAALARVRRAGVPSLGGGGGRYDTDYPSVINLSGIGRTVGAEHQIYAGLSSEAAFTDNWTGSYFGFAALSATVARTEAPRRLKPFDLYYHMYVGQQSAAVEAIKRQLTDVQEGPYVPIEASFYSQMAQGFYQAKIDQTGPLTFQITDRGSLQTFRFDDAEDLDVDFAASIGVLGASRANDAIYVALEPGADDIRIVFRKRSDAAGTIPYLIQSRWIVRNLERQPDGIEIQMRGYGAGDTGFGGLTPGKYHVVAQRGGTQLWSDEIEVASDGRLDFTIIAQAKDWITLRAVRVDS